MPPDTFDRYRIASGDRPGTLVFAGEFDAAAHEAVRVALEAALAERGPDAPGEIVVDLRAVGGMDAGTVWLLLRARQSALDTGRRLRVTGVDGVVRRAVEAAGAGHQLFVPVDVGTPDDRVRAVEDRHRVAGEQARIVARVQQQVVDAEVRSTRKVLLAELRQRLRVDPQALCGEEFLGVADRSTVLDAIMVTATVVGAADASVLYLVDPETAGLRVVRHRGFSTETLRLLGLGRPTAAAVAAAAGEAVLVDDIARSPIFAGKANRDVLLAAGSRAVHAYPLRDQAGALLGVLTFHYRVVRPRRGDGERVAWCAARALARTGQR
ncbi:hypothetical protein Val02_36090 [Virgisporangium aliadipatigenens]|uniref:STAS domain-containing protein n=1 Tax=Virgisporangium aliadipatigenens TaxID=741659 RepID=A0A8J4DRF4_9ACTN|nr:STAS domain-containing protein [Virgisporangium aliadipatigenens]GIJ46723.1 hypothetical protein Val02_36090 [Virgisporangium aliadipatigenens]